VRPAARCPVDRGEESVPASVRTTTTRYRTLDSRPCPGCREALPPDARFCTECGLCLLSAGTTELDLDDIEEIEFEEIEIEI
jgi:hypothetical protein